RATISVVIVAGACGIAAGTPLAILGAIGRAARAGSVIKGGLYLEILSTIDTVVLDKTGTLTFGNPEITEVRPCAGVSATALLETAAIAEQPSEHPLGKAIVKKASERSVPTVALDRFEYIPGKGIVCSVGGEEIIVGNRTLLKERGLEVGEIAIAPAHVSEVLVARGKLLLGSLWLADVLRPEAVQAMNSLRRMGIQTLLLTGDAKAVAN